MTEEIQAIEKNKTKKQQSVTLSKFRTRIYYGYKCSMSNNLASANSSRSLRKARWSNSNLLRQQIHHYNDKKSYVPWLHQAYQSLTPFNLRAGGQRKKIK